MTGRRRVLGAVLALLSLPPLVALVEAASFHARNRNSGSIVSSGERREYLLYVPTSYDSKTPTPLVISLHGGGLWPAQQRDLSGWDRLAEQLGFLVVYPAGLPVGSTGPAGWRVNREGAGLTKDVRFISDLIDDLEQSYSIDPTRIYANGLSNGGGMAFVLSCTLSDRIAAVGTVAAAQMLPFRWCPDRRPVPVIAFHGTADPLVPYDGGASWVSPGAFSDVAQFTEDWARRNRCAAEPVRSTPAPGITRREYTGCSLGAAVVLYTIDGGGHTWPGGKPLPEWFVGPTTLSVDATDEMWAFFREHQLVRRPFND